MKKILVIQILVIIINLAFSQEVLLPKGISTDPDNPVNPENDEFDEIDYFFDWRNPDNGDYYNVENFFWTDKIRSPYNMPPMWVTHPFIELSDYNDSDYQPADGWELVKHNLGTKMDGTIRSDKLKAPYMVLYNKNSSILRIFIADRPEANWQNALITISYLPPEGMNTVFYDGQRYFCSALLSCNSVVAQPLNEFTEISKIEIPTKYLNDHQLFMWVDIPVTYDPCVCLFHSNLLIDFLMLNKSQINLSGSLLTTKGITGEHNGNNAALLSSLTTTLIHSAAAGTTPSPTS